MYVWVTLLLLTILWGSVPTVFGSTAGEITYNTEGRPMPVKDPAIVYFSETPPHIQKLPKKIEVDLSDQTLSYYYGDDFKVDEIKISSGLKKTPTPIGTFSVKDKVPVKVYQGPGYYLPNTKWNLKFLPSGYYIHGAYWHNNFGNPMSHGCVNVPYSQMEKLYHFADVGTRVIITN